MRSGALRATLSLGLLLSLSGCGVYDRWFGGKEEPPLPGTRIPVLQADRTPRADPLLAGTSIILPSALPNTEWPQSGGNADHALGHVSLGETLSRAWAVSIGEASDRGRRILAQPVVARGMVFAMDAETRVTAVNAQTGERAWSVDLAPKGAEGGFGGGVAYADGRVFVTTGYAQLIALDPASGAELWRRNVRTPIRCAPTVADNRVYATTLDNRLEVTDATTGTPMWTHSGIAETTVLLGHSSPAYADGVVVVPYSSGEIFGLRADNGRMIWSDSLTSVRRADVVSDLADIRGLPVISAGVVYAVGHSGRSAAIGLRSGTRLWEKDFGGVNMPWLAADSVFLMTTENTLLALSASDGRVRWTTQLAAFEDPQRKETRIIWSGPILAGSRLFLTNSLGQAGIFSPFTGEKLGELALPSRTLIPPVVADQTLYVLSEDATLSAYR